LVAGHLDAGLMIEQHCGLLSTSSIFTSRQKFRYQNS
jgi:hypothetical protein